MQPATAYEAFEASCENFASRPFLYVPSAACASYADGPFRCSYGEALGRVRALAERYAGAREAGVGRVGLMLHNRPEFFFHWLALNSLGIGVVPLNHEMTPPELAYILEHSGLGHVVALEECAPLLAGLRSACARPFESFAPDAIPAHWDGSGAPDAMGAPGLERECALLYTSGSTGKPKGCVLSNRYFLLSGERYLGLGGACEIRPGEERCITPLPLVHMNAMACSSMAMLMSGGCIVQLDRFHPSTWWDSVRESGATMLHYLGVMPAILLDAEPSPDDSLAGRVRFGFGAGVNPEQHAPFEERFGFPLVEAWGMTETGNFGAIIASDEPRKVGTACFGRPPDHLEIRLVDEAGADCPAGEPGELLVRCRGDDPRRGFFSGYLHDAAATEEAWSGGWFHTGDIVRRDADGDLYFVDRKKNVIRRSGENISALELETQLVDHPAVAQVIACPVADTVRGEEVMLCVVAAGDSAADEATARAIFDRAMARLSYFKAPGWVGFFDALPLTASQKPRRAEIRALAERAVSDGRAFDLRALKRRPRAESA